MLHSLILYHLVIFQEKMVLLFCCSLCTSRSLIKKKICWLLSKASSNAYFSISCAEKYIVRGIARVSLGFVPPDWAICLVNRASLTICSADSKRAKRIYSSTISQLNLYQYHLCPRCHKIEMPISYLDIQALDPQGAHKKESPNIQTATPRVTASANC